MNPRNSQRDVQRRRINPRALNILQLLHWVYVVQKAHEVTGKVVARLGPVGFRSNVGDLTRVGALGCRVDCSNSTAYDLGQLPEDAEAVHDFVWRMDLTTKGLIISHAAGDTQPESMAGVIPKRVPKLRPNGKPVYKYADPDTKTRRIGIVEVWDIDPDFVKFHQETRKKWECGLEKICNHFNSVEGWSLSGLQK